MTTENTTEQEEPSVSINGVQKPIAELNATQKYYVAQIQDLESQEKQHNAKLHQIMHSIHTACLKYGTQEDGYINYVKGANIAGFVKVADAMLAQGVV